MRDILLWHPVKKVTAGFLQDPGTINAFKTTTGLFNNLADPLDVQGPDSAIVQSHIEFTGISLDWLLFMRLFRTESGPLLAVKHVGSGHLVVLTAHEDQFDLILNVLDMQGAT